MSLSSIFQRSLLLFFPSLFCLFALSYTSPLQAQESPQLTLNVGYWGNNIWNPGVKLGLEYARQVKSKSNRRGKEVLVQSFFSGDMGAYVDPGSHTGLLSQVGLHIRKWRPGKVYYSWGVSPVGVYRSFLPETYEVGDNGTVNRVTLPGRFYFAPGVHFSVGKQLKNRPGIGWFGGVDLMGLVPYNTYAMVLVNVQLGCRFELKNTRQ
jgi:hypothetical protein